MKFLIVNALILVHWPGFQMCLIDLQRNNVHLLACHRCSPFVHESAFNPPLSLSLLPMRLPHIFLSLILLPLSTPLSCPSGQISVQNLTSPCTCLSSFPGTDRIGCGKHTNAINFCHTSLDCATANPAPALPSTTWRECDPLTDNNFTFYCTDLECPAGLFVNTTTNATTCDPCPPGTYQQDKR